jgi:hypothetical protein
MLSDPEDAETELLLASSMLAKYERYMIRNDADKDQPVFLPR